MVVLKTHVLGRYWGIRISNSHAHKHKQASIATFALVGPPTVFSFACTSRCHCVHVLNPYTHAILCHVTHQHAGCAAIPTTDSKDTRASKFCRAHRRVDGQPTELTIDLPAEYGRVLEGARGRRGSASGSLIGLPRNPTTMPVSTGGRMTREWSGGVASVVWGGPC